MIEPERPVKKSILDLANEFSLGEPRGNYPSSHPRGAIIHYSGSRPGTKAVDLMLDMKKNGLLYVIIDENGGLHMHEDALKSWGYHAGPSYWPGLGSNISNNLIGIEVMCPGKSAAVDLDYVFYPWWSPSKPIKNNKICRVFEKDEDNVKAGVYWPFTDEQEDTLQSFLFALKDGEPIDGHFSFDLVLGHDEVRGPSNGKHTKWEKTDPGGCLSRTMPAYRSMLKKLYKKEST